MTSQLLLATQYNYINLHSILSSFEQACTLTTVLTDRVIILTTLLKPQHCQRIAGNKQSVAILSSGDTYTISTLALVPNSPSSLILIVVSGLKGFNLQPQTKTW